MGNAWNLFIKVLKIYVLEAQTWEMEKKEANMGASTVISPGLYQISI